ncbi:MAG: gamma-glutamylcyclotransferase [Candidatus Thiodiazotropha taylori]|nr:gamma-glutamylcyclotransferase [Candidatus Thiodiazotropha taylori]
MESDKDNNIDSTDDCIVHDHPVPPEQLSRYSIDRDHYSESDIASYVEGQAQNENILHVERIKKEIVLGDIYEIWDVTTDKDRWWVITNLTNLYSQKYFPSLDYTLSFHIGLMMRLRSRSTGADVDDPSPFDEVLRREEQAEKGHESAIEAEDFQAVGMLLREALLALIGAIRRRVDYTEIVELPQDSNFIEWSSLLLNCICPGSSNKSLRQHLKNISKESWQLVNWLTHAKNADKTASSIAIHSCQTVIGHFIQILERSKSGEINACPVCKSRNIRTHFDIGIGDDGEYFMSCGVCDWSDHPGVS